MIHSPSDDDTRALVGRETPGSTYGFIFCQVGRRGRGRDPLSAEVLFSFFLIPHLFIVYTASTLLLISFSLTQYIDVQLGSHSHAEGFLSLRPPPFPSAVHAFSFKDWEAFFLSMLERRA